MQELGQPHCRRDEEAQWRLQTPSTNYSVNYSLMPEENTIVSGERTGVNKHMYLVILTVGITLRI